MELFKLVNAARLKKPYQSNNMKYLMSIAILAAICTGCQWSSSNPTIGRENKRICTHTTDYRSLDEVSKSRIDVLTLDANTKFTFETIEWNNGQLSFVSAKMIRKIREKSTETDYTNYFYSQLSGEHFPNSMKAHEILLKKISSGALISRKKFERLFNKRSCEDLYAKFAQE